MSVPMSHIYVGRRNHQVPAMEEYRRQQILSSSPLERLLIVYDVALQASAHQDLDRFSRAIGVLRNSLDLSEGEVAASLLGLYLYCGDLAREGRWEEAADILHELREAWEMAGREARPMPAAK